MAKTRYKIKQNHIPYFQTATIVGWLPILTRPDTVQILLDSFQWLRENSSRRVYRCASYTKNNKIVMKIVVKI